MKALVALYSILTLAACTTSQKLASEPSYTIQNPDIYATVQPVVDDNGVPLALPAPKEAFPWASGTKGIAD